MMAVVSSVSSLIVEDLGKASLASIEGISATSHIKLLNIMVKNRPRRWKFFTTNQYLGYNYHISDILSNISPDTLQDIKIEQLTIPGYDSERTIGAGINGKASLKIIEGFPSLKAGAGVNSSMCVKIISGGLVMKSIDNKEFEKAMRGRTLDREHTFANSFCKKSRRRLCVIKAVVETSKDTVIEFANAFGGNVNIAAEVGSQGGSVNAEYNKSKTARETIPAGTLLACQWQPLDVEKDTGKVSLCHKLRVEERSKILCQSVQQKPTEEEAGADEKLKESVQKENEIIAIDNDTNAEIVESEPQVDEADEEPNDDGGANRDEGDESDEEPNDDGGANRDEGDESDEESHEYEDDEDETDDNEESFMHQGVITLDARDYQNLYKMVFAREDDIQKLKNASYAVMKSNKDIEAILDMYEGGEDNDVEVQTFSGNLQNSDAVWSLLKFIGYKCENNHIKMTCDGPFPWIIRSLLQAMLAFDIEDLELIAHCNAYQKKEILRIIVAALERPDTIPIDPVFKQELQKGPVENIMALLSFDVDFIKGELSQESSKICILEPMMYLLTCL